MSSICETRPENKVLVFEYLETEKLEDKQVKFDLKHLKTAAAGRGVSVENDLSVSSVCLWWGDDRVATQAPGQPSLERQRVEGDEDEE